MSLPPWPLLVRVMCRALRPALASVCLLSSCALPAPASPVARAEERAKAAPSAPQAGDPALDPATVRCGVDDGPTPIGNLEATAIDRRFLGIVAASPPPADAKLAPPSVELSASLSGADLSAFFAVCGEAAALGDQGALSISLVIASGGLLRQTRALSPTPSRYARCLAERACGLPLQPALGGKTAELRVETKVLAPVFHGAVTAELMPASLDSIEAKKRQRGRPWLMPQAQQVRLKTLARRVGLACAQTHPPAATLRFDVTLTEAVKGSPTFATCTALGHGRTLCDCFVQGLTAALDGKSSGQPPPPDSAQLFVQIEVPEPPEAPPEGVLPQ